MGSLGTKSLVLVNFITGKMKFVQGKMASFWNPKREMKQESSV